MALIKKGLENTSAILEIGTFSRFPSQKTTFTIPFNAMSGDGKCESLSAGWKIRKFNLNDPAEHKQYIMSVPMGVVLSRSRATALITKRDGLSEQEISDLKGFMRRAKYFVDKNDPKQYDRNTNERIGSNADADFWFEDLRESRVAEESIIEETVAINMALIEMKSDESSLRDALYLIGEKPESTDTASELYFQLIVKLIKEQDASKRKTFVEFYVKESSTKEHIEAQKWIKKGLVHEVITVHGNTFMFGTDRLGDNEEQAVKFIMSNESTRRFLINSISNKSGLKEDVSAAKAEFSKVEDESEDVIDEKRGIDFVKSRAKEIGLTTNPGPMFSGCKTLKDAVTKYNSKLKEQNLPNPVFLSEDSVMEAIQAKA